MKIRSATAGLLLCAGAAGAEIVQMPSVQGGASAAVRPEVVSAVATEVLLRIVDEAMPALGLSHRFSDVDVYNSDSFGVTTRSYNRTRVELGTRGVDIALPPLPAPDKSFVELYSHRADALPREADFADWSPNRSEVVPLPPTVWMSAASMAAVVMVRRSRRRHG